MRILWGKIAMVGSMFLEPWRLGNRIHTIVTMLSVLALVLVLVSGGFYYQSLVHEALRESTHHAQMRIENAAALVSFRLSKDADVTRAMAGMQIFRETLLSPGESSIVASTNNVLEEFRSALGVDVCYLIDPHGDTIASSNHTEPDSFVGRTFTFQPYFRLHALHTVTSYLALGTTSNRRGVYHSFPVRHDGKSLGLLVVKRHIGNLEQQLSVGSDEHLLVADNHGVVFLSTTPQWRMQTLDRLSPAEEALLVAERQFGAGPWQWTGLKRQEHRMLGPGSTYDVFEQPLAGHPLWRLLYLRPSVSIYRAITQPFLTVKGVLVPVVCVLACLMVALIYRQGRRELRRRQIDFDIFPQKVAQTRKEHHLAVIKAGSALQMEEERPHLDGIHTYLSVKPPLSIRAGEISGVCGISVDISDVKKAQQALRRHAEGTLARQEHERKAIARELHDCLGQNLTAMHLTAVWLQSHISDTSDEVHRGLSDMCSMIDATINDVRELAYRLRPEILDDLGLVEALTQLAADFERRTSINCVFQQVGPRNQSKLVDTVVYRITQEALTNVARHAHAQRVEIYLSTSKRSLKLVIQDDGCGFDLNQVVERGGLGVMGMQERALLVGGKLMVESRPEGGTEICFSCEQAESTGELVTYD